MGACGDHGGLCCLISGDNLSDGKYLTYSNAKV